MNYKASINDIMEIAAEKVGIEGWVGYQWEKLTGGNVVTGQVPDGVYSSGPRKGEPRFRNHAEAHKKTVAISDADVQEAAKAYENKSGCCWYCKGKGRVFAGWSSANGTRYKPCDYCKASGFALTP